jgi:hypothetical protein
MKIVRTTNKVQCHFGQRETKLFLELLKLYPRIPPGHQKLSRGAKLPEPEANQRLLDDALAEQRAENQQRVQALLADPKRFAPVKEGCRVSLSAVDLEWLLQVFNDIRIGSWVRLGSPEEPLTRLNPGTAPNFWAMEGAGYFEMQFLEALS